jgi:hypothetical protein
LSAIWIERKGHENEITLGERQVGRGAGVGAEGPAAGGIVEMGDPRRTHKKRNMGGSGQVEKNKSSRFALDEADDIVVFGCTIVKERTLTLPISVFLEP